MIEFMVLTLPRSASTWMSNWLTTDNTLCIHDPLEYTTYYELDHTETKQTLGISCTAGFLFWEKMNQHPARKVMVHRDLEEINQSMNTLGFPQMTKEHHEMLYKVEGLHVTMEEVFKYPKQIYEYLLNKEFNQERFNELVRMEINPDFSKIKILKEYGLC